MKGRQLLLLFLPLTSHVTTVIELIQSCLKFSSCLKETNYSTLQMNKLTRILTYLRYEDEQIFYSCMF